MSETPKRIISEFDKLVHDVEVVHYHEQWEGVAKFLLRNSAAELRAMPREGNDLRRFDRIAELEELAQ